MISNTRKLRLAQKRLEEINRKTSLRETSDLLKEVNMKLSSYRDSYDEIDHSNVDPQQEYSDSNDTEETLKRLNKAEEKIAEALQKLRSHQAEIDDTKKELKKAGETIEDSKTKLIETLGIFIALFAFVSIEFNLGKNLDEWGVVSFSLILAGILLIFVLSLDYVIRYWRFEWEVNEVNNNQNLSLSKFHNKWFNHFSILLFISVLLIIAGVVIRFNNPVGNKDITSNVLIPVRQNSEIHNVATQSSGLE